MENKLDYIELQLSKRIEALMLDQEFNDKLIELITICHDTAVYKGWWNPGKTPGEQIALFHSEISEALEELRNNRPKHEIYYNGELGTVRKPEGFTVELVDCIIRIFDTTGRYELPLIRGLFEKMLYNLTRSHRHGGKKL